MSNVAIDFEPRLVTKRRPDGVKVEFWQIYRIAKLQDGSLREDPNFERGPQSKEEAEAMCAELREQHSL